MNRASLHTLGCRLNQAETAVLASRLQRDGYHVVEFGEPTDLLVVNTCSVTDEAERTCRYVIRKTLKHSPKAFVAVTGCDLFAGGGAGAAGDPGLHDRHAGCAAGAGRLRLAPSRQAP